MTAPAYVPSPGPVQTRGGVLRRRLRLPRLQRLEGARHRAPADQRTPAARRRAPHQRTAARRRRPPDQRVRRLHGLLGRLRSRLLPGPVPPGALGDRATAGRAPSEELSRLAALHGVATSYSPSPDRTVAASATAVTPRWPPSASTRRPRTPSAPPSTAREHALARAAAAAHRGRLGQPRTPGRARRTARGRPAEHPHRTGRDPRLGRADLPPGVHALTATTPDGRTAHAHLIVAPARLPAPPGTLLRPPGPALLPALPPLLGHGRPRRPRRARRLGRTRLGAGFVQVNPLHAAVPGPPTDPSPYRPSSRRFPDPVHLRVEDVPEFAYAGDRDRVRTPAGARGASCARRCWRRAR